MGVTSPGDPGVSAAQTLVDIYDRAVPQLYGYFLPRCSSASLAEELTAETFMGAVTAVNRNSATEVSVAWLIGIARHKLVDHWRHVERERRSLGCWRAIRRTPMILGKPTSTPRSPTSP